MEAKKSMKYDGSNIDTDPTAGNSDSSPEQTSEYTLTRRSFIGGGAAIAIATAFQGPSIDKSPTPSSKVDPNLVADRFVRQEPAEGVSMELIESLYEEEPPVEEEPESKKDEEEKPEPKPKGMELFKAKDLPEAIIDRIKHEGLPGKINNQRNIYEHVENKRGVPWQLMAAINYREASLRPELSMLDGSPLTAGRSQDGVKIYNDAKKDAVKAADILINNARRNYDVDITKPGELSEVDIANALLSYNRGAMYLNNPGGALSVKHSPYVYNYMDGKQMKWARADSYNGSKRLNRMYDKGMKDGNLGAFVIATYLMKNS